MIRFCFYIIVCLSIVSCKQERKVSLFTASGALQSSLDIIDSFRCKISSEITCNSASSGILARQINSGAQADIFISADKKWIEYLIDNGKVDKNNVFELAQNSLVIISKKDKTHPEIMFDTLFDIRQTISKRIAIGNPEYVPVGAYAKMFLDNLKWYDLVIDKAILANDVSAALHYVEMGECDWGVVYKSEALKSDLVRIDYEIPENLYPEVVFYLCRLNTKSTDADAFYEFIKSDISKSVFVNNGFKIKN